MPEPTVFLKNTRLVSQLFMHCGTIPIAEVAPRSFPVECSLLPLLCRIRCCSWTAFSTLLTVWAEGGLEMGYRKSTSTCSVEFSIEIYTFFFVSLAGNPPVEKRGDPAARGPPGIEYVVVVVFYYIHTGSQRSVARSHLRDADDKDHQC